MAITRKRGDDLIIIRCRWLSLSLSQMQLKVFLMSWLLSLILTWLKHMTWHCHVLHQTSVTLFRACHEEQGRADNCKWFVINNPCFILSQLLGLKHKVILSMFESVRSIFLISTSRRLFRSICIGETISMPESDTGPGQTRSWIRQSYFYFQFAGLVSRQANKNPGLGERNLLIWSIIKITKIY